MAGANGVAKFLRVNREEQLDPLQTIGLQFFQTRTVIFDNNLLPITGTSFLNDIVFNASGIYTGPTAQDVFAQLSLRAVPQVGNRFQQVIENTTNADVTINMGAGFTPAAITIAANSVATVQWEITGISPPTFRLFSLEYQLLNGAPPPLPSPPFVLPPGVVPGDLFEWDGAAWVPSSTISGAIPGILDSVTTTNPATTKVDVDAWMMINDPSVRNFLPGVAIDTRDQVLGVNVPLFQNWFQAGVKSIIHPTFDPQDPDMLLCANFFSQMDDPLNVPLPDPPGPEEFVYHFVGCTGIPPITDLRCGWTASGNTYALTYNVLSGQDAKTNIESAEHISSKRMRDLQPRRFNYKRGSTSASKSIGLVVEEVEKVFPGVMCTPKRELVDREGHKRSVNVEGNYMSMTSLVGYLVGVIKDLEERVTELETKK